MAHIVVMGAGIGGMPAAYELRAALGRSHQVTVVNAQDYFQFVPSNPWLAVGWREREAITFPIRPCLEKKGIEFVAKRVDTLDAAGNTLVLEDGTRLAYDYLVITTGPKLAFDEVPGAGPQLHTQSICSVDHAQTAHEAYQAFLLEPGPAVIGAMPGASCFGPAYEFAFIFNKDLQRASCATRCRSPSSPSEPYIGHRAQHRRGTGRRAGHPQGQLERDLPGRHG
jgi:sulfide:quinone oxidoreductase